MSRFLAIVLFVLCTHLSFGQEPEIQKVLDKYNSHSVEYMTVEQLIQRDSIVLLDAREIYEYETSHLQNAIYVGHENFKKKYVTNVVQDKNATIVVYCSIGVRSEQIAEKVKKMGYTNVYNLYGGIFDWKNKGNDVVTKEGKTTDEVHTYSKEWSSYLKKGKKIY